MPAPNPKTFVAQEVISEVDMNAISDSLRETPAVKATQPNSIWFLETGGVSGILPPPPNTKKHRLTIENNTIKWESIDLELLATDTSPSVSGNVRTYQATKYSHTPLPDYLFVFVRAWYTISGVPSGFNWFIQSPMICFLNLPVPGNPRTSFDFSHNDTINSYTLPATGEIWLDKTLNRMSVRIREHQSSQAANRDINRVELLAIRNG